MEGEGDDPALQNLYYYQTIMDGRMQEKIRPDMLDRAENFDVLVLKK